MSRELCAAELAEMLGGALVGATDANVCGVASLEDAEPGQISFLANKKYHGLVLPSRASIVLVPEDFEPVPPEGRAWIVCANTNMAFQKVVMHFAPPAVEHSPGIHPTAVVDESAQVAESVHVAPNAVVDASATIGAGSVIGAGSYIGQEVQIGENCLIYPNVTILERCVLGNRVTIHSGTTIGSDGYAYVFGPTGHQKIPQVGIVQIDDDVEIGACSAVDRARFGRTWIQQGTKIDNLVQIAHNV
ncbi:MAG: UDP-3-O-(3-hydroxymyristoyl)glucosamine N-acyltransferase, partial [Lentisphaeria bacterium]|nr:UDP-3-O-(3-hydroxymyristoyl)glucosamine N-acyltransferase [Lentisphaeria bacterium]